jgi:hypothetical protein
MRPLSPVVDVQPESLEPKYKEQAKVEKGTKNKKK